MNRMLLGQSGLGEIEALHSTMAFNKGVDWFTEVFFFYGLCFGIVFYEMYLAAKSSIK